MAVATRQSELFAGQDWTVIYRAFSQINFNASDPPSINAALRNYIQANYPEDYNDWIVSSEFVAIIDLLSWLAGSLAFKTDIAVRENFLETAESRDSILRLARFLSYNTSRCLPANGVLKIVSVATDDDVYDSLGTDLSNTQIVWNNTNDPNWYERFIAILNNAFIGTNPYGIPLKQGTVQNVFAQQYRLNCLMSTNQFGFSATVGGNGGTPMAFEICNGTFDNNGTLYEQIPNPTSAFNFYYLNDSNGNGSTRTGFFLLFKQGSTGYQDFVIGQPVANQLLDLSSGNINQNDVWVQTVDDNGNVLTTWTQVPIVLNSNITYNSLPADQRYIYSVITRDNDQITIRFSDGLYGNAPSGNIRVTYRASNGLSYTMNPLDINNVQLPFYYINPQGVQKTLYLTFSLQETVSNAATTESIQDIQSRATQVYATQNRMVNGEDYNTFPLQTNLARRIKAVNRVYSGQSRYIDLNDPTGTYQDLNLFEEDGIFFMQENDTYVEVQTYLNYTPADIVNLYIQPLISSVSMANAVRDIYMKAILNETIQAPSGLIWNQSTSIIYNTTGWFTIPSTSLAAANALIVIGAQIQFLMPDGITKIWTTVIEPTEGSITSIPVANTNGPVTLTNVIPSNSKVVAILPRYISNFSSTTLTTIISNISKNLSFGLSYDYFSGSGTWNVVTSQTSLGNPVLTGTSIFLVNIIYVPGGNSLSGVFQITGRGYEYVFESVSSVEWFDDGSRAIDQSTAQAVQDTINILKFNVNLNDPSGKALKNNYGLTISKIYFYEDGTVEPRRTTVTFQDSNGYGTPDSPDTFYIITNSSGAYYDNYLFWYTLGGNVFAYPYVSNSTSTSGVLIAYDTDTLMNADTTQAVGTEAFIMSSSNSLLNNTFWTYTSTLSGNTTTYSWVQDFSQSWEYAIGRGPNVVGKWVTSSGIVVPNNEQLAFQWKHYAPSDSRIDPSITNIHDIFVLTYSYDTAVRQWIKSGAVASEMPTPPTELDLRLAFSSMENYRMFSDGIIWRPVTYKYLFGTGAITSLQANFKVIRLPNATLSDGEIKTQIINAINNYFDISLWDFGDTFYYTELAAYIHQQLAGIIASIVIVPLSADGTFGDDFEIESDPDEILVSTATVANIQIITSNTPANLRIR